MSDRYGFPQIIEKPVSEPLPAVNPDVAEVMRDIDAFAYCALHGLSTVSEKRAVIEATVTAMAARIQKLEAEQCDAITWSMLAQKAEKAEAALAEAQKWERAMIDQCMAVESCLVANDPYKTLNNLIDWHVQNASAEAQKDAEQYQWLLDHCVIEVTSNGDLGIRFNCDFEHYNDVRAAIGAAIARKEAGEK